MSKLEQLVLNIKIQEYIENIDGRDIKNFFKDNFSETALLTFKEAMIDQDINKLGSLIFTEYSKYIKSILIPSIQEELTSGKLSVNVVEQLLNRTHK